MTPHECDKELEKQAFELWNTRPERATLTDAYVQLVPDYCDRIVWRGFYYHLPITKAIERELVNIKFELLDAIGDYFDLGYLEGKQNRNHDTEDGVAQCKIIEIENLIDSIITSVKEK